MRSIALGLMSGTSADGVSIAAAAFKPSLRVIAYKTYAYPPVLRQRILNAINLKAPEISKLHFDLGHFFARQTIAFLNVSGISKKQVEVIGSHGQTIYHGPQDTTINTLQIGEASFIAQKTGIPTVCDFRPSDIAAGGEGAPLIPFFDRYFFASDRPVALQNIGGISNVTWLAKNSKTIAFDNGPGNCLLDFAVHKLTRGRLHYDRNGKFAARGKVLFKYVDKILSHPYFFIKPPKSTGRETFNARMIPAALFKKSLPDVAATLTFATALAIYSSCSRFLSFSSLSRMIVSGGGALNPSMMHDLKQLFKPIPVESFQSLGIHPQAKEPVAFAFFAWQAYHGKLNHCPESTGAKSPAILGKIIPVFRHANH